MIDMTKYIKAKSTQLNAEDLISGSITVKITGVSEQAGDQPIAINYDGDNGRPYLPCKTMRKVLAALWGADGSAYVGRSMTLYREPKVTWAGQEVGGIRISHLSHITGEITLSLAASNKKKSLITILPLGENTTKKPVDVAALKEAAQSIALSGTDALKQWFGSLTADEKLSVKDFLEEYKKIASQHDNKEGETL